MTFLILLSGKKEGSLFPAGKERKKEKDPLFTSRGPPGNRAREGHTDGPSRLPEKKKKKGGRSFPPDRGTPNFLRETARKKKAGENSVHLGGREKRD